MMLKIPGRLNLQAVELFTVNTFTIAGSCIGGRFLVESSGHDRRYAVRVSKNGLLGTHSGSGECSVLTMLKLAAKSAIMSDQRAPSFPPPMTCMDCASEASLDLRPPEAEVAEQIAEVILDRLTKSDQTHSRIDIELSERVEELENTSGLWFRQRRTVVMVEITLLRDNMQHRSYKLRGTSIDQIMAQMDLLSLFLRRSNDDMPPPTNLDGVLFSPIALDQILAKGVMIRERRNEDAGLPDKGLSISDDANLSDGIRSGPIDQEGVPTQKTQLFRNGSRVGDLRALSPDPALPSTGNGWRLRDHLPVPVPRMLIVDIGSSKWTDLVDEMEYGVIVNQCTLRNTSEGEAYVWPLEAFVIKNGRIGGRAGHQPHPICPIQDLLSYGVPCRDAWQVGICHTPHVFLDSAHILTVNRLSR